MIENNNAVQKAINAYLPEMRALRQQIHSNPETGFEEKATSAIVAKLLREWGYEVTTGVAGTGVVASLQNGNGQKKLALRADMDALPVFEQTGLSYASKIDGKMHACGHDGHTTSLLTAARYLAQTRNFSGTLNLIFQPAEEGLGGAKRMVEEKVFKKFPCDAIFGYHNVPGIAAGNFCFIPGSATAASDRAKIIVKGKSGHGAQPETAVDPIVVGAAIVGSLQTIVSRNIAPFKSAVVTVASFHAGDAYNIIPATAELKLTIRSYDEKTRGLLEERIREVAQYQAKVFGAECEIAYFRLNPSCKNDETLTTFARGVAEKTFGKNVIEERTVPFGFSEDFSYMLQEKPGCYLFVGNGGSANLHSDHYNFNDELLLRMGTYWVRLVESYLC
ncbi:M20 aminoacylase family protein [uncultured Bartonella sp.]|uniref:M20 aminoacylase family protein n=1 Tax=uncultured Bartonella sp. TaxID=104108 RepID=UPI002616761F|nr:M20 aminoacylase family protein [uncultured Bartonella sp.]